jgi:L-threonylcarbamoyladenylate synthase
MHTSLHSQYDPQILETAQTILARGGLIAFPTDTVYGLAADLHDQQAIQAIFSAKGRDFNKAIAVLIGSIDQLDQVASEITPAAARLCEHFWPGALTVVLPRHPDLPEILSPLPTIGVRMPDHIFARNLINSCGPLAVTSANLSGMANPVTAQDVLAQLEGRIDLIIDGGACEGGVPSTVIDCTGADIKILRQGAIPAEEIFKIIKA